MDQDGYSQQQLVELCDCMVSYFEGDPKRIQHLLKVHSFAWLIGSIEKLDEATLFILEAAAYTHDIGIKPAEALYGECGGKLQEALGPEQAEKKFGSCEGKLQEQEGPIVAQKMLSEVGIENYMVERICYLIGHHHTYDAIDGMDYQILVEADFLVNMLEEEMSKKSIRKAYELIFKTECGKRICRTMFGIDDE